MQIETLRIKSELARLSLITHLFVFYAEYEFGELLYHPVLNLFEKSLILRSNILLDQKRGFTV